jgi:hypothetical protein
VKKFRGGEEGNLEAQHKRSLDCILHTTTRNHRQQQEDRQQQTAKE